MDSGKKQSPAPPASSGRAPLAPFVVGVAVLAGILALVFSKQDPDEAAGPSTPAQTAPPGSPDTAKTGTPPPAPVPDEIAAKFDTQTPSLVKGVAFEPIPDEKKAFAAYAGSASCRECHEEAWDEWWASNHGQAERKVEFERDRAAFEPPRSFEHGGETSGARVKDGRLEVLTKGPSGRKEAFVAERVIGATPLIQYLVDIGKGRIQTLGPSYDPHKDEWFSVYEDEPRQPGEWGHWTGRGMNWNSSCASCHNTRLRKNYDPATDTYHTSMAEMTVGCEACHGPMKDHVDWQNANPAPADPAAAKPDPTIVRFDRTQIVETCATCHSRRAELTGDFVPGDPYGDHHSLSLPDETDLWYADGQVQGENYVYTSFKSSPMHAAGVHCMDCHLPHSTKNLFEGNVLCMRCHNGSTQGSPIIGEKTHSFHEEGSEGALCTNCHMPYTTYMARHPRRDHGFTIPDPLLTKQFGIPNACNRCHTKKEEGVDWALDWVEKWYGNRMQRPTRERAQWIARARRGDDEARDPLLEMLTSEKIPLWRAVAAGLLERWVYDREVARALLDKLADPDPMVRGAAARSLDPLIGQGLAAVENAVRKLLGDPLRKVRIDAAWTLRRTIDLKSTAARELLRWMDFISDQPSGQMQKGVFAISRGKPEEAVGHYRQAAEWDGLSAQMRHELAVVLSMAGKFEQAVAALKEAIALEPKHADFHYKIGLAYNEIGEKDKMLASLRKATDLDPGHARAWYNLGLALNGQGKEKEAVAALEMAEKAAPQDPQIPYAKATILVRLRRPAEAEAAMARARQLNARQQARGEQLRELR